MCVCVCVCVCVCAYRATQDAVQEAKATLGGTGPLEGTRTPEATPMPPDTTHTTTATPVQDTLSKALDVAAAAVTQLVKSSEDVVVSVTSHLWTYLVLLSRLLQ